RSFLTSEEILKLQRTKGRHTNVKVKSLPQSPLPQLDR
ncbi:unnamed protein product, partial [Arabidopsis halleri]